jgi:aspartyl protease family protein
MRKYQLSHVGNLYLCRAAVKGPLGVSVLRLLVDTGSTYTILPVEVLDALGCNPAISKDHVRVTTGSGYLLVPEVEVTWFQVLGKRRKNFRVVAHTLPSVGPIDGLLGMDFLVAMKAKIDLAHGTVEIP